MKKVLGLNLLGSNPSSSSHTSFNWAWLPCGEEQQEHVNNESESHRIRSDSPVCPPINFSPFKPELQYFNSQQPMEQFYIGRFFGFWFLVFFPQGLLGVIVLHLQFFSPA